MKKTRKFAVWPMSKGLDLTSIPGTQAPTALRKAKNISLTTKASMRKRPGLVKIPAIGNSDGVQNATQFYATSGGAKISEVVRMRYGRFEALRDVDGSEPQYVDVRVDNEDGTFSDVGANPTDKVTFEQFANILIVSIENRAPLYYTVRGNLRALSIRSTHTSLPPSFFRGHDFRMFYGGIENDRDRLFVSGPNSITDYSLLGGGFAMRFDDGDGDPIGLTGVSRKFRGDLYVYKWNSIYRVYRSSYGYGIDGITDEAGAVSHTCILTTQNDVYSVDTGGIRSLALTDKYGAAEETTLTWPIYEYFQDNVNWSAYKNFYLSYDKQSATLLFAYTSTNSTTNDRVLGMNLRTREFFEWDNCEYSAIGKYIYYGHQHTFVHCSVNGASILDINENTIGQSGIDVEIETGVIFPFGEPKATFSATQAWLLARPTTKSVEVQIQYSLDGKEPVTRTVDTLGTGYGATISEEDIAGVIGTDNIGRMAKDMAILPFKFEGDGSSLQFRIIQEPPDDDPDQPFECYGIIYELEFDEDSTAKVTV